MVDGTGEPAYKADVAVKNGVTVAVGTNLVHPPGVRIVNAAGVYRKNEFRSHIFYYQNTHENRRSGVEPERNVRWQYVF